MKTKILVVGIVSILALAGVAGLTLADKNGQAGKSNKAHLYMYEKDPTTWDIVQDGSWGKMTHNLEGSTFDFVFNGHDLEPGMEYTLIYYGNMEYNDEWPYATCLANGVVNDGGNIHLAGSYDFGYDLIDAKLWLVLSDDVDCEDGMMTAWNPTYYLFENNLINFDDTDA